MENTIKILGINSDTDTCSKCGKTNLKKVVWMEINGSLEHLGIDCAGAVKFGTKNRKNSKIIESEATAATLAKKWIERFGVQKTAEHIWNRFGFLTNVKNDRLFIKGIGWI